MFNFLKKKKDIQGTNAVELTDEQVVAFFKADKEAKEKADLVNKIGTYIFTCPTAATYVKANGYASTLWEIFTDIQAVKPAMFI